MLAELAVSVVIAVAYAASDSALGCGSVLKRVLRIANLNCPLASSPVSHVSTSPTVLRVEDAVDERAFPRDPRVRERREGRGNVGVVRERALRVKQAKRVAGEQGPGRERRSSRPRLGIVSVDPVPSDWTPLVVFRTSSEYV